MTERLCDRCGIKITECNGFVNAGDFVRLMKGETNTVRELCGRCVIVAEGLIQCADGPTPGDRKCPS